MATICDGCLGDGCPCGYKSPPPEITKLTTFHKFINYSPFRRAKDGTKIGFNKPYYVREVTISLDDRVVNTIRNIVTEEHFLALKLKGEA